MDTITIISATENPHRPTAAFLNSIDIHGLLPQKEPFIMIDALTGYDDRQTSTVFKVRRDNIFFEEGALTYSGLIENIAQTCAARIGYMNKYILRKDVRPGVVGAIQNLEILSFPRIGEVLDTTVTVEAEISGMIMIGAVVECNGKRIVTARVKMAVPNGEEGGTK